MSTDIIKEIAINDLVDSPVGKWLGQAVETISTVQRTLFALAESDDSYQFSLLKITIIRNNFQLYNLTENYRNTINITEYCNNTLHRKDVPIGYKGTKVRELNKEKFISAISSSLINRIEDERRAIIVNDINDPIVTQIKSLIPGKFIINGIKKGLISILSIEYAKGLEFDVVYVYGQGMEEKHLYVAFTRALERLVVCSIPNIPKNAFKPILFEESKTSATEHQIYDREGFDKRGFDRNGIHRITKKFYDLEGKDRSGKQITEGPSYSQIRTSRKRAARRKSFLEDEVQTDAGYLDNGNKYYYGGDK